MRKTVNFLGFIVLLFVFVAFVPKESSSLISGESYCKAECSNSSWYRKFYYTVGDQESKSDAAKKANKAAREHKEKTGHDTGYRCIH